MAGESVDQLREQLRVRGYLTHGIERWFALDPWRSRTFWVELLIVAVKAAAIVAVFASLPEVAIMLARNHPLSPIETSVMLILYAVSWLAMVALFIVAIALLLKVRPALVIDTPRALLAISLAAAAALVAPIATWWLKFDNPPGTLELAFGVLLILTLFLVSTVVISAALLAFTVYELKRVPAIHRKPRSLPLTISAAVMMILLFAAAYAAQERRAPRAPIQVVTAASNRRIAFIAVDGLTFEIFRSRPELTRLLRSAGPTPPVNGKSTTERWASVGTGVATAIHGVRSIEGIRLAGGTHVIQSLSRMDPVLRILGPAVALARREPLPPTVRKRDYIWEIFAARGIASVAVNWWTTATGHFGALDSIGQETLFTAAKGDPTRVDEESGKQFGERLDRDNPQFATIYLPALDVILNRLPLDPSSRLSASVRALNELDSVVAETQRRNYEIALVGLPGDHQSGEGVVASAFMLPDKPTALDLAPTILSLLGFPASHEMPGRVLAGDEVRIDSYGPRSGGAPTAKVDQEYYESLKSLGYIK